ncbi:hypothetical protein ACH5RR_032339 [Cinchona calisaya]|uniref:Uncharacterized protein n=1 Tax=Cinchona calisaya TaxID=153742 RepID=A0ABD2YM73_9GENT
MAEAIIPNLLFPHSGTSPGVIFEVDIVAKLCDRFMSLQYYLRKFLADATQNQKDEDVRSWIQEVRCLVYLVENVIDLFAHQIHQYKTAAQKGCLKKTTCVSSKQAYEIKEVDKCSEVVKLIELRIIELLSFAKTKGIDRSHEVDVRVRVEEYYGHEIDDDRQESIMFEMKGDIDKLLSLLLCNNQDHQIVSILGVGGSGKTTVARKIYYHIKTRIHFAAFAWLSMTNYQNDITIALKDILKQLSKSNSTNRKINNDNSSEEVLSTELRRKLHEYDEEKKCSLLVLEDIRNKQVVESIKSCLGRNTKLLLAAPNREVAQQGFIHKIIGLSEDQAWEILKKRAYRPPLPGLAAVDELVPINEYLNRHRSFMDIPDFGSLIRKPDSDARIKEHVGRIMIRSCGYLPIAILVLAEILRFSYKWKHVGEQLHLINERSMRILMHSLLGDGMSNHEQPADKEAVGDRLNSLFFWSYDELTDELRECFLYLSHFAEDDYVDVETLYLMWIAEGLVIPRSEMLTLMDVAELYLTVLARRHLVEVKVAAVRDFRSRYESCRVTSRMRGPWLEELREQSGYLKVFRGNLVSDKEETSSQNISSTRNVTTVANAYRMAISTNRGLNGNDCKKVADKVVQLAQSQPYSSTMELIKRAQAGSTDELMMRSLLFRNTSGAGELPPRITLLDESLVKLIKGVRILVFESYKFEDNKELEKVLENLTLLRFLSFKNSELDELPSSACTSSPYLEALDLRVAWGYHIRISNTFWKAKKLRYLYFSDTSMEVVDGKKLRLSGLDNLEVLVNFQSDVMEIGDISKLENLRVLKAVVRDNNSLSWIVNHKLKCDLYLRIRGCDSEDIRKLGEKEAESPKLQFLEILETLRGNKLPTYIQDISSSLLELVLVLSEIHQEHDPMITLEKFPKLQRLVLGNRAFLGQEMVCSQSGFPSLKSICLTELANLHQWTIANGAMPNLSRLVIKRCLNLKLPDGLNNFSSTLKQLSTWSMPKRFNESVRELGLKWNGAECSFSFNLELKNDI